MKIKMYDALNGVEKIVKDVVKIAVYSEQIFITDIHGTEFFVPSDESENYCLYITDNKVRKNND